MDNALFTRRTQKWNCIKSDSIDEVFITHRWPVIGDRSRPVHPVIGADLWRPSSRVGSLTVSFSGHGRRTVAVDFETESGQPRKPNGQCLKLTCQHRFANAHHRTVLIRCVSTLFSGSGHELDARLSWQAAFKGRDLSSMGHLKWE